MQKRIAAVHDISCFGRCSLTVALPILSAAGIETSVVPTAVLSTHTGGFTGFTFRDLSDDMLPIAEHWKREKLHFDGFYTGYLGSFSQIETVSKMFDLLADEKSLIFVDPVMADNGKLYPLFGKDFPAGMAKLCERADIIVPNITEASLLLGIDYKDGPYEKPYIEDLMKRLADRFSAKVILTGVSYDEKFLGAACFDGNRTDSFLMDKIDGYYHGTGDVFGSAALAAYMNGKTLPEAMAFAVKFTHGCIKRTFESGSDIRFGVDFEHGTSELCALSK